jgi:hypothetical protein
MTGAQVIDIRDRRPTQGPDPLEVCYHEAGHAVMAALSPYHEVGDTILQTEDRKLTKSNGQSFYKRLQVNDLWEFRIVVAGGAGERILSPDVDPFNVDNLFTLAPSAAQLDIICCDFILGDDEDPEEHCAKQDRIIKGACRLLKKHELAVHKVAKILRTKGRISGDEVRAIVGPARKVKQSKEAHLDW